MNSVQSVAEAISRFHSLGFFYPDATQGFQYDIVSSYKPTPEGAITQASLCGFNCTKDKGNYNCPSAATLNQGVSKATFAPASFILEMSDRYEEGLDLVRKRFIEEGLDLFCRENRICNKHVRQAIKHVFEKKKTEANLFGGDSEQHPEVVSIIRELKRRGMKVNLTATGGRWLNDPRYVEQLLEDPPQVICVSLDDMTVLEFLEYSRMSAEELKSAYKALDKIDWDYGQKKKALAGFYVARYLTSLPGGLPCGLLFNTVLAPGNISQIGEITHLAQSTFPGLIVNPYPGQGSFAFEDVEVNTGYLCALERFVDAAIAKTLEGGKFVRRLHYWLILKAAFNVYGDDPKRLAELMSGYGLWTCYRQPMAGFYVQPSRSVVPVAPLTVKLGKTVRPGDVSGYPGAYPGCYWNPTTVTESRQPQSGLEVADHIWVNKPKLAASSAKPCPGCLMPRLMFNYVSSWKGLDPLDHALRSEVIKLRLQHAGF